MMNSSDAADEENDQSDSCSSPSTIEVHLRIRPSSNPSSYHEIDDVDRSTLIFTVPAATATTSKGGYVDNTRTRYAFKFNSILEPSTSQATVFKNIGVPAIRNALDGYNSTVFAYGQTGSGKTFTITGGPERYEDRGIIPRSITLLFEEFSKRKEATGASFSCYISYLELYNESGYDLLAADVASSTSSASSTTVPKVTMLEDEDGNYHFRNLSIHPAKSEEEALNLLFLGDTNRAIGETEMNQSSSRSHCIFTVMIECRPAHGASAEGTLLRSKVNLVDLSGSERVHKTSSTGQTLTEAKYINSSLFFLEMVIVALHERASGRGTTTHVPYRNSMMTSVLRDSLGGNCKTVMIATISPEAAQLSESISTCQFAQRVALVRNSAEINEEVEPAVIIRRLRAEVGRLREEVKYLKGENAEEEDGDGGTDGFGLHCDQMSDLERRVQEYVEDRNERSVLDVGTVTLTRMQFACTIFKRMLVAERSGNCADDSLRETASANTCTSLRDQVSELERTLRRRDHEITILVDMVKKKNALPMTASFQQVAHLFGACSDDQGSSNSAVSCDASGSSGASTIEEFGPKERMHHPPKATICGVERCVDRKVIEDLSAAFAFFQQQYPGTSALDETKAQLKAKYQEAKDIGQIVQRSKALINKHSRSIEALRRSRAMDGLTLGGTFDQERIMEPHPDEQEHRKTIQLEKIVYSDALDRLKDLKGQIQYSQQLVEKNRLALQRDFERWYAEAAVEGGGRGGRAIKNSQQFLEKDEISSSSAGNLAPNAAENFQLPAGVKLTGNKDVDDDIVAFYRAKAELMATKGGP